LEYVEVWKGGRLTSEEGELEVELVEYTGRFRKGGGLNSGGWGLEVLVEYKKVEKRGMLNTEEGD
jgi:hypothetical protein